MEFVNTNYKVMKNKASSLIASFINWYIAAMTKVIYPKNCCKNECYYDKSKAYYMTHK